MIKITQKKIYISPETQQSMYDFFMRTSAPRILAKMKEIEAAGGKSVKEQIKEYKKKNK